MAENVILAERTLTFTYDETYGAYLHHGLGEDGALLFLTEGETYQIVWDGTEYSCTAFSAENSGITTNNLGNTIAFGGEDNGIPFLIASNVESGGASVFALGTEETHTIAIYQVVEDEEPETPPEEETPEGIVLKDRNGKDVEYYGIETVTFDTTTKGKQQTYTKGVAVEGLEIVPDFSGGDMPVSAGEGIMVKSATIKKPDALFPDNIRNGVDIGGVAGTFIGDTEEQTVALSMADGDMVIEPSAVGKVLSQVMVQKPETLVPENIAEGIDIAGVIGTLVAGGTSKVAFGTFSSSSTSSTNTISHNLGVVPDFVIVFARYVPSTKTGYFCNIGFSNAFVSKFMSGVSSPKYRLSYQKTSSGISIMSDTSVGIETTDSSIYINNANEASFKSGSLVVSSDYYWVAIGGLT